MLILVSSLLIYFFTAQNLKECLKFVLILSVLLFSYSFSSMASSKEILRECGYTAFAAKFMQLKHATVGFVTIYV